MRRVSIVAALLVSLLTTAAVAAPPPAADEPKSGSLPCLAAPESGLPLPSTFAKNNDPAAYENLLGSFLREDRYETLGWCSDKGVRDTGPFIDGIYYGTHPAVRIWYSPNMLQWMIDGRKGDVPDGAMIIKEQFAPTPAAQYRGWTDAQLHKYFFDHYDWTIMIRDRAGSADGWYWGEIWKGIQPDSYAAPFGVFNTGFGLYCVRCHGSAATEQTFSATSNVAHLPGDPLTFRDDYSWFWNGPVQPPTVNPLLAKLVAATREQGAPALRLQASHPSEREVLETTHPHVTQASMPRLAVAHHAANSDWTTFFASAPVDPQPNPLPGENYDHVVSPAGSPQHFITSDQCVGCHSGNRYGNVMLWNDTRIDSKPLVNVSPYGEWRWSPMGLAGRDPVFYSQLDSEVAYLTRSRPDKKSEIVNLCFSCHGAMGQRQLNLDTHGREQFTQAIPQITDLADPRFKYGALGRDGISCAVCHHIKANDEPVMKFIEKEATGRFDYTPADQVGGPFDDPAIVPMKNSLNVQPVHDAYTSNPRICGSCHTIDLPVLDAPPGPAPHEEKYSYEQATYLEWLNSSYQNEIRSGDQSSAKSCQDCHMKGTLAGTTIQTQIAVVEDNQYPAADHRAPNSDLNIPLRASGYVRHEFQGLNVFLLQMFDQFSDTLGVRKCDYMSSGCSGQEPTSGIPFAQRNYVEQASEATAAIAVSRPSITGTTLTADVTVTNHTGHRFPSGVSFRRAFIDFTVRNATTGAVIFESGATNSIGAIVDMSGNVLPSESIGASGPAGRSFQPHYWSPGNPITRSDQVQIYEELLKDADGNFTTSFVRQDEHFKDNRILPLGWTKSGPDLQQFYGRPLDATFAHGTGDDPHYQDPLGAKGESVVRYTITLPGGITADQIVVSAQLYYQAVPPYFLLQRFQQAPSSPATQRLYYITQNLDASKTPFPGWKLRVAQAEAQP